VKWREFCGGGTDNPAEEHHRRQFSPRASLGAHGKARYVGTRRTGSTAAAQNCILPDALESISTIRYRRRGPTAGFKTFSLSRFP
jgi:hypothetical protein